MGKKLEDLDELLKKSKPVPQIQELSSNLVYGGVDHTRCSIDPPDGIVQRTTAVCAQTDVQMSTQPCGGAPVKRRPRVSPTVVWTLAYSMATCMRRSQMPIPQVFEVCARSARGSKQLHHQTAQPTVARFVVISGVPVLPNRETIHRNRARMDRQ